MAEPQTESIAGVVERAAAAYEALGARAEAVEDEWQYVTDLQAAYLPALRGLADGREDELAGEATVAAVDQAIAEIELIADAHKAIDWLSTFPHVVALALGGDVDVAAGARAMGDGDAGAGEPGEDQGNDFDDDSPFRILLGGGR